MMSSASASLAREGFGSEIAGLVADMQVFASDLMAVKVAA
jgi:hypothetical protein